MMIQDAPHEGSGRKTAFLMSELRLIRDQLAMLMGCLNDIASELLEIPECRCIAEEQQNTACIYKSIVDILEQYIFLLTVQNNALQDNFLANLASALIQLEAVSSGTEAAKYTKSVLIKEVNRKNTLLGLGSILLSIAQIIKVLPIIIDYILDYLE